MSAAVGLPRERELQRVCTRLEPADRFQRSFTRLAPGRGGSRARRAPVRSARVSDNGAPMSPAKRRSRCASGAHVFARQARRGLGGWPLRLAALLACAHALGGCGAGSKPQAALEVHASAHCPGGALTRAGARRLLELDSAAGARASLRPGCPYLTAATIGRPGEGVLRQPEALVVGPSGRVYVADQFSHLVQMFSPAGVFEGQWGSGRAGPGEFGAVSGLAVDPHGDVYVLDATHDRVEKYDAAGHLIDSWGGRGTGLGQFDFGAGIGPDKPPGGGIVAGRSFVYVSDARNNRIERFALNGTDATVVASAGSAPGEVQGPQGLALAQEAENPSAGGSGGDGPHAGRATAETLYVADDGNDRVQELTGDGRFIAQATAFDGVPDTFQNPWDVAVRGGSVYVVDDNHGRIVRFDRGLRFNGSFNGSGPYRLSDFLRAVATNAAGDVYVADSSANRIDVYTAAGTPLRGWGSSGIDPGQFVAPLDVAVGPGGRLLVAEAFREIVPLYPTGAPLSYRPEIVYNSPWSSGGEVTLGSRFFTPTGLAFAPDGTVWVSDRDNGLLRHLAASGRFLDAVGSAASADGGDEAVELAEPRGVAVDSRGAVLVADTRADRIDKLAPDGELVAAWSAPTGGFSGWAGSEAGTQGFQRPLAVAVSAAGSTFLTDSGNDRVEELDSQGRLIASWGGRGSAPGRFESPDGLAVDAAGDVFVADGVLDRIQEFTPHGKLLGAWGSAGTGRGELREPTGMGLDCRGDLLVADTGNNRVALFTGVAPRGSCKT